MACPICSGRTIVEEYDEDGAILVWECPKCNQKWIQDASIGSESRKHEPPNLRGQLSSCYNCINWQGLGGSVGKCKKYDTSVDDSMVCDDHDSGQTHE
jgi:hypothetical protein